jgi:hypothetical protein
MWVIGGYYYTPGLGYVLLNDVWWSTDGENWTQATGSAPWLPRSGHESVVFDGKMWVMDGLIDIFSMLSINDVWYSTDGANWTCTDDSAEWGRRFYHSGLVYDNKILVIGGCRYYETAEDDVWSSPGLGIEERSTTYAECVTPNATIIRGVLNLQSAIYNLKSEITLLDITGRKVANLKSGANDIRHLAPGVYFVRHKENNQTRKVVVMR